MLNLVISSEKMGRGDEKIGEILMGKFFTNLCEENFLPKKIFFYNTGVFLCKEGSVLENELKILSERQVMLLACSTCIDYFKIQLLPFVNKSSMKELINILNEGCTII